MSGGKCAAGSGPLGLAQVLTQQATLLPPAVALASVVLTLPLALIVAPLLPPLLLPRALLLVVLLQHLLPCILRSHGRRIRESPD